MRRRGVVGIAALAAGLVAAAPAPPAEAHVRGDVVAVEGDTLRVKPRAGGGEQALKLAGDVRVSVATRADASAIAEGGFVGTTAVPGPGGQLRALEVHVFPEAMRGAGEGHRPWDLRPGSSMTNATVASMGPGAARSSMTNATVQRAEKAGGALKLSLKYKDGEKTVLVPPGTPIVKLEPADRARLVPGAHVFAAGPRQADGTVLVERAMVGEGDVRPPM